jgi:hypothetical protein
MSRQRSPLLVEFEGAQVCRIPLTQGQFALVDAQMISLVSSFTWCAYRRRDTFYACTGIRKPDGSKTSLHLHKLIGTQLGIVGPVDHKNRNGLDNRGSNLRPGPKKLNDANQGKLRTRSTSSVYKGVYWYAQRDRWRASIVSEGKRRSLGYFRDEVSAARAYDAAARMIWGEYARPNFEVERG